jgi:hypothetical protein
MQQNSLNQETARPAREWTTSMAPIPDPVKQRRRAKARHRAELPPK